MSKQGTHWNLKQVAAHVTFPPEAVCEDQTVTVLRWNSSVCFPPLNDNEALVSGIIELSTDSAQGFEFNKAVTLVISHCAADIKGYEVVAKMLMVFIFCCNKQTKVTDCFFRNKNRRY